MATQPSGGKKDINQKNKVIPTVSTQVEKSIETEKSNLESIEASETAAVVDDVVINSPTEDMSTTEPAIDAPVAEVSPEVPVTEVAPEVAPAVEEAPVVDPVITTPPVAAVATTVVEEAMPHYVIFFEQYITLTSNNQLVKSTAALNNCIKSMVRVNTAKAFDDTFKLLSEGNRLQHSSYLTTASSTLSFDDRTIFETIIFCFTMIFNRENKDYNFDGIRSILKNDTFVDWCINK